MRHLCSSALAAIAVVALATPATFAQNLLANPGFEDPIVFSGPNGVGVWFGFNGGGGAAAGNGNISPRTGAQHLVLDIPGVNNNFAGVFQDVLGVVPGQVATFSVWNKYDGPVFDIGAELRIEWRNPGNTVEVGRTANFVPTLTPDYAQFSMSGVVPDGAGVARVVYAIQSFGDGGTNTGTAYVDDAVLTVIPEPGTLAIAGLGLLGLAGLRRRWA